MRHFWTTLALVLALAAGCWVVVFRASCDPAAHAAARSGDVLAWMRCEFHLTDAQYAAILKLHRANSAVCAGHCAAVAAARAHLAQVQRGGSQSTIDAAARELCAAEEICRASTEVHVRRVAAEMAPGEGERYLKMVLPRLAALDHSGPPALTLEH